MHKIFALVAAIMVLASGASADPRIDVRDLGHDSYRIAAQLDPGASQDALRNRLFLEAVQLAEDHGFAGFQIVRSSNTTVPVRRSVHARMEGPEYRPLGARIGQRLTVEQTGSAEAPSGLMVIRLLRSPIGDARGGGPFVRAAEIRAVLDGQPVS